MSLTGWIGELIGTGELVGRTVAVLGTPITAGVVVASTLVAPPSGRRLLVTPTKVVGSGCVALMVTVGTVVVVGILRLGTLVPTALSAIPRANETGRLKGRLFTH